MFRCAPRIAATMLLLVASALSLPSQAAPRRNALHAALAGQWSGALRYRDYQDSTRFVSLPTLLAGTPAGDSSSVQLVFTYDDGPGKTVKETDTFALDASGKTLVWGASNAKRPPSRFAVQTFRDKPFTLVVEMTGEDDDRPARIRETISVDGTQLRILKEVRFATASAWLFRHEYRLTRTSE